MFESRFLIFLLQKIVLKIVLVSYIRKLLLVSTARVFNREIYFQLFLGSDSSKKFLKTVKLLEINDSIARPGDSLLFPADRILQCLQVRNDLCGGHWSVAVVYITAAVQSPFTTEPWHFALGNHCLALCLTILSVLSCLLQYIRLYTTF